MNLWIQRYPKHRTNVQQEDTMVAWDKAKGKQNTGQRREIQRMTMNLGDNKIRLVGDVMPRYCYWVTTTEGRKMPVECLEFSRETESFDNSADNPFKEIDEAVYSDKPQFSYVCNVIDRADGQIKLFDLRSTIYSQIVDYAANPEYGNPADASTPQPPRAVLRAQHSHSLGLLYQSPLQHDVRPLQQHLQK